MKKKWITSILLCCIFAVLLSGCANKPGTNLEAPSTTAASTPNGTDTPGPSGTGTGDATNPATGEALPTEGQPKPTEPEPSQAPKPTEAPKSTEAPKPVHQHSYQAQTVAATCTERGYTLHTCSCGNSYKDSYTSATGHSYDGGRVTQAASCSAEGVKTYTCTKCGSTKTEGIAKTAHSYVETVVAPTYSAGGYTQHTCSVCGHSYTDNETDPLEFDINYWVEYAKDIAREMGFIVREDGEDGLWNGWDDPTIANPARADNGYIESCIRGYLRNYKNDGVRYIWVWAEPNPYTDKRAGWYLYIGYSYG